MTHPADAGFVPAHLGRHHAAAAPGRHRAPQVHRHEAERHESPPCGPRAMRGKMPYLVDLTITSRPRRSSGSLATRNRRQQLEGLFRGPLYDLGCASPSSSPRELPVQLRARERPITATGDVQPCVSVPLAAGNIREAFRRDLEELTRLPADSAATSSPTSGVRGPCGHLEYCAQPGRGAHGLGSYTGIDPVHLRAGRDRRTRSPTGARRPPPGPRWKARPSGRAPRVVR